jgi:hypothetical protein
MTAVATARTWTIKGVSDRTRDAVYEASSAAGLTVGEWIDRALAKAAAEALHPSSPAATRDDMAEVVREQLAPMAERLAALEAKVGRVAGSGAAGKAARRPSAAKGQELGVRTGARPARRRLPEEARAQIEELHRAGRSAYAISKELGVSYNAVRARVRALEAAG